MKSEIVANINDLNEVIEQHKSAHEAGELLMGLYKTNAENISSDSIQILIRTAERTYTYDPSLGNLKSMISSGQLNYINNQELKSLLASLEDQIIDANESTNWLIEIRHDLGLRAKIDFIEPDFSDGVKINKEKWLHSIAFFNWLYYHSINRTDANEEEEELLASLRHILTMIDRELIK